MEAWYTLVNGWRSGTRVGTETGLTVLAGPAGGEAGRAPVQYCRKSSNQGAAPSRTHRISANGAMHQPRRLVIRKLRSDLACLLGNTGTSYHPLQIVQ